MNKLTLVSLCVFTFATLAVPAATIEIRMKNSGQDGVMTFEPGFVQAQVGDTVTFIPTDRAHNSSSVLVPAGAKEWKGKMDQKLSVKLEAEGVYLYKCDPHLPMGMVGLIQVGQAKNRAEAKEKADVLAKGFAMNKERLVKYLGQIK